MGTGGQGTRQFETIYMQIVMKFNMSIAFRHNCQTPEEGSFYHRRNITLCHRTVLKVYFLSNEKLTPEMLSTANIPQAAANIEHRVKTSCVVFEVNEFFLKLSQILP